MSDEYQETDEEYHEMKEEYQVKDQEEDEPASLDYVKKRAGHLGYMTKLYNEVSVLLETPGNLAKIKDCC